MKKGIALITIVLATLACGQSALALPTPTQTAIPQSAQTVEAEETAPTPNARAWTVCADTLRVRGCPMTSCSEVRYLRQGDTVIVREWSSNGNGWAMIQAAEWVNGDYLCQEVSR